MYLTREKSIEAVANIKSLFDGLTALYEKHGINLDGDIGRKNILISAAQEHFFAAAINDITGDCNSDGRTGQADIYIGGEIKRELECKVVSKGEKGSWAFQADKSTLEKKEKCDFLYLLFNRDHSSVGVFLFKDLEPDDFYDPAPGSRGRAKLKKHTAFSKCTPLVGDFENLRLKYMQKYKDSIATARTEKQKKNFEKKYEMWYNKNDSYRILLEDISEL
jgi:hypothetical protein